jgi:uncharacterized protein YbbC (DUF1343 family)
MKVTEIEDRMMARIDTDSKVFEVNFTQLRVHDVTLSFHMNDQRVGSIYNDDGTERLMARLNTVGEEDFISVKVDKDSVAEILEKAEESHYLEQGNSTMKAYKTRMNISQDEEK